MIITQDFHILKIPFLYILIISNDSLDDVSVGDDLALCVTCVSGEAVLR